MRRIKIARLPGGAHQIRCPAQPHQHAGQEGVAELLTRRPWIQLRIQGQGVQGRSVGTGDLQVLHQQVADHRFSTGQSIHATALSIRRQRVTLRILREAGHHCNRRRPGLLQAFTGSQQGIRTPQSPPAGATGTTLKRHLKRRIRGNHRADLQTQAGSAALSHLNLALGQLGLDAGIQQQADPLPSHRPQGPVTHGKPIEAIALHIEHAGIAPIQRSPVHHIGMGDQAAARCSQQACRRQGVTGVATDVTTDARGHQHQRWHRCRAHALITAST